MCPSKFLIIPPSYSCIPGDNSLIASAPTGAGKTGIFEVAMVKLFHQSKSAKGVYMAPTKALCGERFLDWYSFL